MCDLVLDHALISRKHAMFELDDDGHIILTDLNSTQGTFVNGERIQERELRDGDRVGFGREGLVTFRFHYTGEERSAHERHKPDSAIRTTPSGLSSDEIRSHLQAAGEAAALRQRTPLASPVLEDARVSGRTPIQRVGRAPDNEVVLNSPGVSRYHATIRYDAGALPVIEDLGSTNGTFVNGEIIRTPRVLAVDDLVFVGGFILRVDGANIAKYDLSSSRLIAAGISKELGGRKILKDISFAILPKEFIGIMGPSGCGKSTLMDALNGLRPASAGSVFVNDLDLYRNFDTVKRSIGYVPQRDILHDALSVERTLYYVAQLRLPEHTAESEMRRIIDEVIGVVGLEEHRQSSFRHLSGGQQKRLSLALELLTKPNFLFLDEPTSPLDPETSENLMLLFRRLADEGRIVVMVTHKFEQFDQMHHIVLLTKGGHLAYFGPPREALRYFGCQEPGQIYREFAAKDPEQISQRFRQSSQYEAHVARRLTESRQMADATQNLGNQSPPERTRWKRPDFRQWQILTRRYLEIKLRDRRNTLLLIAQAPIIALILALIAGDTVNDGKTLFISAIIAIWFGANNAIREIVAEVPIYQRERLVNLKIPSYLLSKFAVLAMIAIVQCSLFVGVLIGLHRLRSDDLATLLPTLFLTTFGGIALGLLFSAFVTTTEKAMSVLPLLLIPQLLLSGFLKPIDDVYFNVRTVKPATVQQYDGFERAKKEAQSVPRRTPPPDPISRISGLGGGAYASDLMVARWSVDALVHSASRTDLAARDLLATGMFVKAYERVQSGATESEVNRAYTERVWIDWTVIIAYISICLLLAAWALRAKDTL